MEEKKFTIYLHRCPNGKCYVGMTSQSMNQRWRNGLGYKNNKDFYPDIEKYGWNNIEHIVLEEGLNREDACESEKYNIKKYNCIYPNGYNLSIGGDVPWNIGIPMNKELKEKLRKSNIGRTPSNETRLKLSISHIGSKPTNNKKVTCDGLVFNTQLELSRYLDVNYEYINKLLKGRHLPKKWIRRGLAYFEDSIENKIERTESKDNTIELVFNDIVYDSVNSFAIKNNLCEASVRNWIRGKQPMPTNYYNGGLRYYGETIEERNKRVRIGNKSNKLVICDNMIYNKLKECCKVNNLPYSTISKGLNSKMPQKYIDRGLRYYNPETDSHLPIYVDTKD